MQVIGKEYKKEEIIRYLGGTERVNTVDRLKFTEGKASGSEVIAITTGNGLNVIILPERGLDIASVSFKGVNASFLTKNGITGPLAVDFSEGEFNRYFAGGMLTTCGLRNVGPPCTEKNGEHHPVHGKFNTIPAKEVGIFRPDEEKIVITGVIQETALFGPNLKMQRKITINNSSSKICVSDTLINDSDKTEEIMILYHYNFGFPFIQDGCYLEFSTNDKVTPRDDEAKKGIDSYNILTSPIDGFEEQVFFHSQKGDENGFAQANIVNPHLKMKACVQHDTSSLPILAQWKSMKSTDYALGIEPSNSYIMGRVRERENGTLKTIEPFGRIIYETSVSFEAN